MIEGSMLGDLGIVIPAALALHVLIGGIRSALAAHLFRAAPAPRATRDAGAPITDDVIGVAHNVVKLDILSREDRRIVQAMIADERLIAALRIYFERGNAIGLSVLEPYRMNPSGRARSYSILGLYAAQAIEQISDVAYLREHADEIVNFPTALLMTMGAMGAEDAVTSQPYINALLPQMRELRAKINKRIEEGK